MGWGVCGCFSKHKWRADILSLRILREGSVKDSNKGSKWCFLSDCGLFFLSRQCHALSAVSTVKGSKIGMVVMVPCQRNGFAYID